MNRILILLGITALMMNGAALKAQVGINTETPKATLDVMAKTDGVGEPEGIIAPRLTGDELSAKEADYQAAQIGTLIYVTSAATNLSGETKYLTTAGYYYFAYDVDGETLVWKPMGGSVTGTDTSSGYWSIIGNDNITVTPTNPDDMTENGGNFLGTTTDNDLFLGRNKQQAGWINASGGNTAYGLKALPKPSDGDITPPPIHPFGTLPNRGDNSRGGGNLGNNDTPNGGVYNTAIGFNALGSDNTGNSWNNTAVGNSTIFNNKDGSDNTAFGSYALFSNIDGSANTVVGYGALESIASGYGNIAIGNFAASYQSSGNNNITIGNLVDNLDTEGDSQLNIGNAIWGANVNNYTDGTFNDTKIGIGGYGNGETPASTLEVNGAVTNKKSVTDSDEYLVIDFAQSNHAYIDFNPYMTDMPPVVTLKNMKDGGTYYLAYTFPQYIPTIALDPENTNGTIVNLKKEVGVTMPMGGGPDDPPTDASPANAVFMIVCIYDTAYVYINFFN